MIALTFGEPTMLGKFEFLNCGKKEQLILMCWLDVLAVYTDDNKVYVVLMVRNNCFKGLYFLLLGDGKSLSTPPCIKISYHLIQLTINIIVKEIIVNYFFK